MCVSSLVLSRRPKVLKKRSQTLKKPLTPIGSCRDLHIARNINSRLTGAVDRELGENTRFFPQCLIFDFCFESCSKSWATKSCPRGVKTAKMTSNRVAGGVIRPKGHKPRNLKNRYSACKNRSKNIEIQGGTLPIFFVLNLVVRAGMSTLPKFRPKVGSFCCHFGGHFGDFGCQGPHLDPKRAQGPTKTRFYRFLDEKVVPFGGLLGHLFGPFFRSSLRDTKKGCLGGPFKTRHLFWSILGSARRASGGFPCTRELNFHFCSRTQKGLQNGSQKGAFGAPKSELYSLWGAICEKLVPKKLLQKMGAKSRG